jgi:hypothetical protein
MLTLCCANGKAGAEIISPPRALGHEGKDFSSWSSCPLRSKAGFGLGLGDLGTEYRSVTPGNGGVLAEDGLFSKMRHAGRQTRRARRARSRLSPVAEKLKRFKVIKSKKYKMKLKLGQIGLPNRMRRMAARWRKSRKNRSSLFCDSCAFSLLFRRCQVPDGQINRAPCQEYAQTSNHE